MKIEMKKFGDVLTSRQAGRESYAAFLPTARDIANQEELIIDFAGVSVLSPSWADEFLTPLLEKFGKRLKVVPSPNPSVELTIKTIEEVLKKKISKTG